MIAEIPTKSFLFVATRRKLAAYLALTKFRLALLVVFSAAVTFVYARSGSFFTAEWWRTLILLCGGGFLVTASSNAINQLLEEEVDRAMVRTRGRPVPSGLIGLFETAVVSGVMGLAGLACLLSINSLCALLGAFALCMYAFIYTPLKKVGPIAVYVGAVPGAMPVLIGWCAATGSITPAAVILFIFQLTWQFPHFWSIAWVLKDDYKLAGINLMPYGGERDRKSAASVLTSTVVLVITSFVPIWAHMGGTLLATVCGASGVCFIILAVQLYNRLSVAAASRVMFGSFFYLPLIQAALILDHFITS